ncbi:hypothetical protein RND71_010825 [Anisodus tanguticus]|uniref:Uncharacterized protein n=1 Tax=Anisodus tanguticus TaxID=243964 RepID=A0AAE1VT04_9SOLA|nr:hypothetical protein RND71_010825 [Anisodus tanguticus]
MLGQQALQGSSASIPAFGYSSSKGTRSSTNSSKGRSSVAEKIKKTLVLLDLFGSKNASVKKDNDTSSN